MLYVHYSESIVSTVHAMIIDEYCSHTHGNTVYTVILYITGDD